MNNTWKWNAVSSRILAILTLVLVMPLVSKASAEQSPLESKEVQQALALAEKVPSGLKTPAIKLGSKFLTRKTFLNDSSLGVVTDIRTGKLDSDPAVTMCIAGTESAKFLNTSGKVISTVKLQKAQSDKPFSNIEPGTHMIVDVDGDGICEFISRGSWASLPCLFDHQGKPLWSFTNENAPDDMSSGDLDGDGLLEFVVGLNGGGGVHILDKNGIELCSQEDGNVWHVETADIDKNGCNEIIHSNASGEMTIRDSKCNIVNRYTLPVYFSDFSLINWPGVSDTRVLAVSGGYTWLFDYAGKTVLKLRTPDSSYLNRVYSTSVKLIQGKPSYLAVLVNYENWDRSALYIYDQKHNLVYEQILSGNYKSVSARSTGKAETLLVGGKGLVLEYKR